MFRCSFKSKLDLQLLIAIILSSSALPVATVQADQVVPVGPLLRYLDLETMAQTAINEEVESLNAAVRKMGPRELYSGNPPEIPGYRNTDLNIFLKMDKGRGLDPAMLHDICILTSESISALMGPQFTKANLGVHDNIDAVKNLKTTMNKKFFGVVESVCVGARHRFAKQLALTYPALPAAAAQNATDIVFFPTKYGRTTLSRNLIEMMPFVLSTASLIGSSISILGWPKAGIFMSVTGIVASALNIRNLVRKQYVIVQQKLTCSNIIQPPLPPELIAEPKSE